jgi:hypothetical protein
MLSIISVEKLSLCRNPKHGSAASAKATPSSSNLELASDRGESPPGAILTKAGTSGLTASAATPGRTPKKAEEEAEREASTETSPDPTEIEPALNVGLAEPPESTAAAVLDGAEKEQTRSRTLPVSKNPNLKVQNHTRNGRLGGWLSCVDDRDASGLMMVLV